jgi:hypothetical protein
VFVFNERLDHVVYGGDGGVDTPQRAAVVKAIRAYRPSKVRLMGDNCYAVGCIDKETTEKHVIIPFGDLGPQHDETDTTLGNHSFYGLGKERAYFQKTFSKPVGKVRWDNYYKLKVYYNACEVFYESTVADVKVGSPDIEERQEDFVCKAVKDPRCAGKLMIGVTHQADRGKGKRGDSSSRRYREFGERCLHPNLDYVLSGHEHENIFSGRYGRALYFISGTLGKLKSGKVGYLTLDNGVIRMQTVNTAPTMAEEEED